MNRAQRIVLIACCLLLAYCCLWIPWCEYYHVSGEFRTHTYYRMGYGWLWAGPHMASIGLTYAQPDNQLIIIRLLAAIAIGGALFLLAA